MLCGSAFVTFIQTRNLSVLGGIMMLTLGDSVTWGQGLIDDHKFDRIYGGDKLLPRSAHSGAVIGSEKDNSNQKEHPEVPVPYPSLWQQALGVRDWSGTDLVILNGGINDVSLTRILNPWIQADQIAQLTKQFCSAEMTDLLASLGSRVAPNTRIAVIGYYPILSNKSDPMNEKQPRMLLEMHGVATASVAVNATVDLASIFPRIIENSLTFWKASNEALKEAVAEANQILGSDMCHFVDSGFTEANSLWAPEPLLWELTPDLDAQDEVKPLRDRACAACYGDLVHLPTWGQWYTCCRASVGHPNVDGAAQIAAQIQTIS
jgi:lysophospholipase L1-like esterase